ncbi:MAG TPA: head-tail connector protein [Alphaproteobacteria bacterium]|nr:head-tail connector protein [Alphaproteobacteria bacterium]
MTEPFRIVVKTAPSGFPVSLEEAKLQLRVDAETEDDLIEWLIAAATDAAEKFTGRVFLTRTFQMYLDRWPSQAAQREWWDGVREGADVGDPVRAIELPYPPLASVVAVTVYDDNDGAAVWPASNYHIDNKATPGRLALRMGGTIPLPTKTINGIEIEYTAGYGAAGNVPVLIKQAILRLVAYLYENRGDDGDTAITNTGAGVLLGQYRIMRLS